ncbi:putative P-loop containing nucleoside triphosphate hydrolase [Medicago truncatula]|uniref:50S ribosome-binding GTPase n=1 Tax=Medicago truncatula TaxID=3880 RepID=G7L061_MEDTR|nr:uncharacterized protein LOC11443006 isoform X2 [Medicago truncatula]AES79090.1 50S ribosome-binding GTPase [Medicago truncatula]RHN45774.1 putative P-loop containing nucleoside triphosphate hydrolase [Medicago truncatula]
MGGGSIVSSNGKQHEDSCSDDDFPPIARDTLHLQNKDDRENEKNGLDFGEVNEETAQPSNGVGFVVGERKRLSIYQEILQSYDELKIDSISLKQAKEKILRYRPGTWIEKARGLKLRDYDVPETTSLILVGPSGSGKSSLINRISKVFDDDKFAPTRAQVSYNSLRGDGTYFLREHMIPRDSNSICLYDTRSLSNKSHENNEMLKNWMTEGVHHGELVIRSKDNQTLTESLKCKGNKKGFFSSKSRKVNFVIYVLNGLSVLNMMENADGAFKARYIEEIVSTFNFNNPFLSFKDDKPVLVLTHGDLLSLSDRARVRVYLGEVLGIPPTKQIFDIPECDDLVTESAIIGMLRYTLEHADNNIPQKTNVMNKVHKISLSLFMILMMLAIGFAIGLKQNNSITYVTQQQAPQPHTCREVQETLTNLEVCKKELETERLKLEVPKMEPQIVLPKQEVPEEESKEGSLLWFFLLNATLPICLVLCGCCVRSY